MLVFRKEKMKNRLIAEGKAEFIVRNVEQIMDNLDGCECTEQCWRRIVHGEPVVYCHGRDGSSEYVNEADCEYVI